MANKNLSLAKVLFKHSKVKGVKTRHSIDNNGHQHDKKIRAVSRSTNILMISSTIKIKVINYIAKNGRD